MKNKVNIGAAMIAFAIAIGLSFVTVIYFQNAWSWFVVPLGLPSLSYWHAYGLQLFISILMPSKNTDKRSPYLNIMTRFIVSTILYFVLMGIHALM